MSTWFLCWWDKAAKRNRIRTLQSDDGGSKLQKFHFSMVTLLSTQYPINPNNIFPHYLSPQLGLLDPVKLAYDRPSPKLIAFLRKNYKMINHDLQPNRFAIFDGFPLWKFQCEGIYPCSPGLKCVVTAIIIRYRTSDVLHISSLWCSCAQIDYYLWWLFPSSPLSFDSRPVIDGLGRIENITHDENITHILIDCCMTAVCFWNNTLKKRRNHIAESNI